MVASTKELVIEGASTAIINTFLVTPTGVIREFCALSSFPSTERNEDRHGMLFVVRDWMISPRLLLFAVLLSRVLALIPQTLYRRSFYRNTPDKQADEVPRLHHCALELFMATLVGLQDPPASTSNYHKETRVTFRS